MVDDMLHPSEVGIALRRCPELPALVVLQTLAAPIGDIERRIGEDEIGLQVGMAVVVKAVAVGDLALNAPDRQVHLGQPPRSVIRLLTIDRNVREGTAAVTVARGVGLDEFHRLHEHARRAAARIIDPALVRLQHLD